MSSEDDHFYDGLDEVDRQIRLEKLKRELEERGAMLPEETDEKLPSEIETDFLENVLFYESAPRTTYAKMLLSDGVALPPVESMDAVALEKKLWEIIHSLAKRQIYLYNTDHLSDAELYTLLWGDHLNEETVDISLNPFAACHLDLLGGCSEEDILTYLRYYASEAERFEWRDEFDEKAMPASEKPPYDRDRHLPKRPMN